MNPLRFFMMLRAGAILLLVLAAAGQAAVLTYPMGYSQDDDNPDFPAGTSGASVTSTYGDNITQADIDAGYYGAAGGPTPNVLVWNDYENIYFKVRNDGYGDLPSVLCSPYNWYMLEFKADDNHLIDLHDFDLATVEPFAVFSARAASGGVLFLAGTCLLVSVFYPRLWCRFLCPTGRIISLLRWGLFAREVRREGRS